jgi:peroxiredoxin Q/BCP
MPEPVVLASGDPAPPISATATGDGPFSLADARGKWVVVYFYPRANTPG